MQPFGHSTHGPKNWGLCPSPPGPFLGWVGPYLTLKSPGQRRTGYLHTKWHLSPSSRLGTTDMGLGLCLQGSRELPAAFYVRCCLICGVYTDLRSVAISLKSLEPDLR